MKKAVRKGAAKAVALVLSLAMIFGMAPMVNASAGDSAAASASTTTESTFDRIVHLDMGRKYFSPEWIKALINEISALGYTQLELDFSNNEGFRFSLPYDQMQIEVGGYETVLMEVEAEETQSPETDAAAVGDTDVTDSALPQASDAAQPEEGTGEADAAQTSEPAGSSEAESEPQYKEVQVYNSKTVDLTKALSQDYITAEQMEDIIACAKEAGIEIVPLLNSPGHMGAILNKFPEYRWTDNQNRISESTIDLENDEAVRFAEGVVSAYAEWFAKQGCKTFNIGADEFANDLGTEYSPVMGLNYIYYNQPEVYSKLIEYINDLAVIIEKAGMTPRAFNDSFCYKDDTDYAPSTDIQVCYWSPGWNEYAYDLAEASTLEKRGYQLINTHGDYYYVLGKEDSWDSSDTYRYDFDNNTFAGGSNISDPVGSMFCIWSDYPNDETEQKVAEKVRVPLRIMAARMQDQIVTADTVDTSVTPGGFNADGTINVPAASVTDNVTNITVSASGVTSISAVKHEKAIPALADSTYVAYDISLNNGNYTQSAQVSIPLPEDWIYSDVQLRGFVLSSDGKVEYADDGSLNDGIYTFTAPHFSTVGVAVMAEPDQTVSVAVNSEKSITISGDYSNAQADVQNGNIAAVTVGKYTPGQGGIICGNKVTAPDGTYFISDGNGNYLEVYSAGYSSYAVRNTRNVTEATQWKISKSGSSYTIYDPATRRYLTDGASLSRRPYNWSYDPDKGFYYITEEWEWIDWVEKTYYLSGGNNWSTAESTSSYGAAYEIAQQPVEGTTEITVSGLQVGETLVTVNDYVIKVVVTEEDLSGVSPLTIELFITNRRLNYNGTNTIAIEAQAAATEEGYQFSDIPARIADGDVEYAFWKVVEIDYNSSASATHAGTGAGGSGQTHKGIFGDIQCTCDGSDKTMADDTHTMTAVRYRNGGWQYQNADGQWVDIKDNDQLVAYYLQVTDVTTELETQVVDYGARQDGFYLIGKEDWALLDFQVEYPSGFYPNDFANEKTLLYHNNTGKGRTIGMIRASLSDPYYVLSRIEVLTASSTNYWSVGTLSQIDIQYDEASAEVVWTSKSGTDPIVPSLTFGESNGRDNVKLVRYVLEVNPEYSNLTVHYINETSGQEFHSYDIATRTAGESVEEAADFTGWTLNDGNLTPGVITNALGREETVYYRTDDLAKVPNMNPAYTSGFFEFANKITVSSDGDDLYLYYSTDKNAATAIVDFGLPVKIGPTFFDKNASSISAVGDSGSGVTGNYGTLRKDGSGNYIYTPSKIMNGSETFRMKVTIGAQSIDWVLYVVPASTVYYEDTFGAIEYGEGWETVGTPITGRTQTTSKLGDKAVYGHDAAYATDTTYSGGSAHKVTLTSGETATATFSFHGTGFQLVSMTDATSGCITVHVEGGEINNYYFVDCYYANGGALYQVPVLKVDDLALGNYTVTVTAGHLSSSDWNGDKESTFVLDGVRIYKPIGDYPNYTQDNEGNVTYSEIRNILLYDGAWDQSNSVYVDTLGASTNSAADYANVGPNNEVYLKAGDQITFTVPEGGSIVQIGAKLVSGKEMTFTVEGQDYEITSAVEMYYLLDGVKPGNEITITASGDGILSLTNLKLVSGS